jgi:hypothetical protein
MDYMRALCAALNVSHPIQTQQKQGKLEEGLLVDLLLSSERATRLLDWRPRHPNLIEQPALYYEAWRNR